MPSRAELDRMAAACRDFDRDISTVPSSSAAAEDTVASKPSKKKKRKLREQPAPASAPADRSAASRDVDDLDDIFGGLKEKRARAQQRAAAQAQAEAEREARSKARASASASESGGLVQDPVFGESYDPRKKVRPQHARVHRIDRPSGLNVYKAHDLGLGHGGGTPLCPFDCSCCF